jgi:phosphoglycolate phosphatase-like HAD superfamily hydrolase
VSVRTVDADSDRLAEQPALGRAGVVDLDELGGTGAAGSERHGEHRHGCIGLRLEMVPDRYGESLARPSHLRGGRFGVRAIASSRPFGAVGCERAATHSWPLEHPVGSSVVTDVGSARMPPLVLFDVDGTLITSGGAGARAWAFAFDHLYGVPADIGSHSEAGETDPAVARGTFTAAVGREPTQDELARLFGAYLRRLDDEVASSQGYRVLEGVEALLVSLADAGTMLGIVSGAMEGAARVKLARGRLNRFFLFGGYGSDSPERTSLTRVAIEKAGVLHGHDLEPRSVLVVGDTPRDVRAAHATGCVAVGVASGHYGVDELAQAGADHVLASLAETFPTR